MIGKNLRRYFLLAMVMITVAIGLTGCKGQTCPDEFATPGSRRAWCGQGNAGA